MARTRKPLKAEFGCELRTRSCNGPGFFMSGGLANDAIVLLFDYDYCGGAHIVRGQGHLRAGQVQRASARRAIVREFKVYEQWQVIAVSQTGDLLVAILGNPEIIAVYQAGVPGNGKPFPERDRAGHLA